MIESTDTTVKKFSAFLAKHIIILSIEGNMKIPKTIVMNWENWMHETIIFAIFVKFLWK